MIRISVTGLPYSQIGALRDLLNPLSSRGAITIISGYDLSRGRSERITLETPRRFGPIIVSYLQLLGLQPTVDSKDALEEEFDRLLETLK